MEFREPKTAKEAEEMIQGCHEGVRGLLSSVNYYYGTDREIPAYLTEEICEYRRRIEYLKGLKFP